jgi:hypothetical protein
VNLRKVTTEAKLLLIGVPVLIWTMLPIYHLLLFAISPKEQAMGGHMWPDHPTLRNFGIVFRQDHHYLNFFWLQMWNSLVIAVGAGLITLMIADRRGIRHQPPKGEGRSAGDEPRLAHLTSFPRRFSPCRCTRRWASTASSTTNGR